MSWKKVVLLATPGVIFGGLVLAYYLFEHADLDMYVSMFNSRCAECHGKDLTGTEHGAALVDRYLEGGDNIAALMHSIVDLHPAQAFSKKLTDYEIKGLAIFVGERRLGQRFSDFRTDSDLVIPEETVQSEEHSFLFETFADDLDPLVFSIAPLPDGSWLLTGKSAGLSIISADGKQSALITGTPETGDLNQSFRGLTAGVGWLLDVAAHPDYARNGWIYLHYTELCLEHCEGASKIFPASMNRLDRGRIRDEQWVDVETIWQAELEHYSTFTDTAAGGRIAFDGNGHVFLSVGFKEVLGLSAQDLNSPYGKIHRVNDDGSIPADNPFVISSENTTQEVPFVRKTIWTYGHRTPQGLEWNARRNRAWNAEMGPRGGDEINELIPGKNYGWPYHSLGLEYTGREVQRNRINDIEFDLATVEQTLVDFTPSPALSSFAFYNGAPFSGWQDNLLLGTLKGSSMYRLVFDGNELIHSERVFKDLGRIRDIEIGYDGLVYLLVESNAGSKIIRLVPID